MPKNIVFCADGTWNRPEPNAGDDTNVLKFYQALAGANTQDCTPDGSEQERIMTGANGEVVQIAKYIDGVGSEGCELQKTVEGATGGGLISRIIRGYTFISRNYRAGDYIYLTGFSRGAYTVRALSALIQAKGVMDATKVDLSNKMFAYQLAAAVWRTRAMELARSNSDKLAAFEIFLTNLAGATDQIPAPSQMTGVNIQAVGVWDTVGALGIPEFDANHEQIDSFQFADRKICTNVLKGFHAVSLDEQRPNFAPTLWDADPAKVTQVLFPGAHSDVGGGYPEDGLSDAALLWMTDHMAMAGVHFGPRVEADPNPLAPAHKPWAHGVFAAVPPVHRTFPAGMPLSDSVKARLGKSVVADPGEAPAIYAPVNLPA
jgi:uncharacterized protein (DUF2235 family)